MAHADYNPMDRGGDIYADRLFNDVGDRGPFKVGKTGGGKSLKRLRGAKSHICPTHAAVVRAQWHFSDVVWAEKQIHARLAAYWMPPPPGAEAGQEWFDCSLAVVEAAVAAVRAEEVVYLKAIKRTVERMSPVLDGYCGELASPHAVVAKILEEKVAGKRKLGDVLYDVFRAPLKSAKMLDTLKGLGLNCLPTEGVVVFRTASEAYVELMRRLGVSSTTRQMKNIVGFDNDGNPVSKKDLQARCPGYRLEQLFA